MFTGIVQETGEILSEEHSADGAKFEIGAVQLLGDLKRGDSISVDGVCLTVSKKRKGAITVEMTPETLKCTNLGERRAGDRVNLEADIVAKYVERLSSAARWPVESEREP